MVTNLKTPLNVSSASNCSAAPDWYLTFLPRGRKEGSYYTKINNKTFPNIPSSTWVSMSSTLQKRKHIFFKLCQLLCKLNRYQDKYGPFPEEQFTAHQNKQTLKQIIKIDVSWPIKGNVQQNSEQRTSNFVRKKSETPSDKK